MLSFLDPKGFRYYIPAYMLWTLDHYATSASATITSIVFHFELDGLTPDHEYSLSRFELLTVAQSVAVCTFLRFMATYSDEAKSADRALNDYWASSAKVKVADANLIYLPAPKTGSHRAGSAPYSSHT